MMWSSVYNGACTNPDLRAPHVTVHFFHLTCVCLCACERACMYAYVLLSVCGKKCSKFEKRYNHLFVSYFHVFFPIGHWFYLLLFSQQKKIIISIEYIACSRARFNTFVIRTEKKHRKKYESYRKMLKKTVEKIPINEQNGRNRDWK